MTISFLSSTKMEVLLELYGSKEFRILKNSLLSERVLPPEEKKKLGKLLSRLEDIPDEIRISEYMLNLTYNVRGFDIFPITVSLRADVEIHPNTLVKNLNREVRCIARGHILLLKQPQVRKNGYQENFLQALIPDLFRLVLDQLHFGDLKSLYFSSSWLFRKLHADDPFWRTLWQKKYPEFKSTNYKRCVLSFGAQTRLYPRYPYLKSQLAKLDRFNLAETTEIQKEMGRAREVGDFDTLSLFLSHIPYKTEKGLFRISFNGLEELKAGNRSQFVNAFVLHRDMLRQEVTIDFQHKIQDLYLSSDHMSKVMMRIIEPPDFSKIKSSDFLYCLRMKWYVLAEYMLVNGISQSTYLFSNNLTKHLKDYPLDLKFIKEVNPEIGKVLEEYQSR